YLPKREDVSTFLDNIFHFKQELKNEGINVVESILTREHAHYFKIGDTFCELYPFFDNIKKSDDERDLLKVLIPLHKVKLAHNYSNHPNSSSRKILDASQFVRSDQIKKILTKLSDYEEMTEKTMLHGDIHIDNIFFMGDQLFLTDFDIACYGTKAHDLGKCLSSKIFFSKEKLVMEKVRFFLSDYLKHIRLSEKDKKSILAHILLQTIITAITARKLDNPKYRHIAYTEERKLKYLLENWTALENFFTSIN
ncbi:MAG: phosphotransferase, partial [Nanoarchaeota archaeon]|nr:phosphotransferase [Nanoarchaeota archaeon]